MQTPRFVTANVRPYAGGIAHLALASAPIDQQGNFSILTDQLGDGQTLILQPPQGTPYKILHILISIGQGTTNVSAEIANAFTVVGSLVGLPNSAAIATDNEGYAIPGSTIGSGLPSQFGHAGQLLTTDGTNGSWSRFVDGGTY